MGIIIFNGIASTDFEIEVEHFPRYETPTHDYEVVHVPGRNGDIYIDKGTYANVSRDYDIAFATLKNDQYTMMANRISEWLHSASEYARLEDSYELEYYRLAVYEEATRLENILNHGGRATISFNCKPQRFLKSGDRAIIFDEDGVLKNPTGFKSLPIITVKGDGEGNFSIGDYTVTISDIGESITINSEIQDAYSGTTNRNLDISLSSGFPKLEKGLNKISFSGGITSMEVIPKWWTL